MLELNSKIGFSKYKNPKKCDEILQVSLKRQLSGSETQVKEQERQKNLHEKIRIILVTECYLKKTCTGKSIFYLGVCNRFLNRRSVIQKKSSLYLKKILWILSNHVMDIFIFAQGVPEK